MTRFLCDVMCGKLVVYLRFCGHDTAYALDRDAEADDRLLGLAAVEDRVVVTRDEQLAGRAGGAILLEAHEVDDQLRELREADVDLSVPVRPVRCGRCNGALSPVSEDAEPPTYAPPGLDASDAPARCRDCGQWFWKGSHWERMAATLAAL